MTEDTCTISSLSAKPVFLFSVSLVHAQVFLLLLTVKGPQEVEDIYRNLDLPLSVTPFVSKVTTTGEALPLPVTSALGLFLLILQMSLMRHISSYQ